MKLRFAEQAFVFVMGANPKPQVSLRNGHGQGAMTAAETRPPVAPALLKAQRAVLRILLPELVGFAGSDAGLGWK